MNIKQHVKEHKTAYAVAAGVTIGFGVGVVLGKGDISVNIIVKSKNVATQNGITTVLKRQGHPGFIVLDNRSGEVYASMRRAKEVLGVTKSAFDKLVQDGTLSVLGDAADLAV